MVARTRRRIGHLDTEVEGEGHGCQDQEEGEEGEQESAHAGTMWVSCT